MLSDTPTLCLSGMDFVLDHYSNMQNSLFQSLYECVAKCVAGSTVIQSNTQMPFMTGILKDFDSLLYVNLLSV